MLGLNLARTRPIKAGSRFPVVTRVSSLSWVQAGFMGSQPRRVLFNAILGAALIAIGAGCNTITFSKTQPDGSKTVVVCSRVFWSTENYEATLGTNSATLRATKSGVDAAAISAAAEGAVRGLSSAIAK